MKTLLLFAAIFAVCAFGQTTQKHSVTLTWVDDLNPAGTTYSVYRATGLCSGTPSFSKIGSAIPDKTYLDETVTPGNYCYTVTATYNGMESAQSPTALAPVPSFPPQGLSIKVQ